MSRAMGAASQADPTGLDSELDLGDAGDRHEMLEGAGSVGPNHSNGR